MPGSMSPATLIRALDLLAYAMEMSSLSTVNISFREATVADCMAVAKVHVRSWQESFAGLVPETFLEKRSVEKRAQAFAEGFSAVSYRMYVADLPECGGIGFADCGKPRENIGAYEGELYAIYLLSEFQRQGIGEKLFNLVIASLIRDKRCSMYLYALEVSPYRAFYEKMGGHVIGRKQIEIEGIQFDELIYGWDNLC
jgi:GNAT superfamily N-acetyltransferase